MFHSRQIFVPDLWVGKQNSFSGGGGLRPEKGGWHILLCFPQVSIHPSHQHAQMNEFLTPGNNPLPRTRPLFACCLNLPQETQRQLPKVLGFQRVPARCVCVYVMMRRLHPVPHWPTGSHTLLWPSEGPGARQRPQLCGGPVAAPKAGHMGVGDKGGGPVTDGKEGKEGAAPPGPWVGKTKRSLNKKVIFPKSIEKMAGKIVMFWQKRVHFGGKSDF